jgi:flagellar hook assembly protein FlgD
MPAASSPLPAEFQLLQNYPNPFNAQSVIEYVLPREMKVRLVVYDALGQIVRRLVDGIQSPGRKRAIWDGKNDLGVKVTSGVYFYQLESVGEASEPLKEQKITRKMVLQQ